MGSAMTRRWGAAAMAGLVLSQIVIAPAWAQKKAPEGDEEPCQIEVLESGEEACVRRRVVSRRVVKRTSKKRKPRAKKKTRSRRRVLIVDPSSHSKSAPKVKAQAPKVSPPKARAQRAPAASVVSAAPAAPVEVDGQGSAQRALADPSAPSGSWRVEGVTDVPLLLGAGMLFEAPSRFRIRSAVGVMPRGYLRLSNALIQGVSQDYPEPAQRFVEEAIEETFTWRTQLGFRLLRRRGLYLHGGYTLLALGGSSSGEELIAIADAFDQEQGELMEGLGASRVEIGSRLHLLDLEVGWDFALSERAALRLGAGWAFTFYSRTRVEASFDQSGQESAAQEALFEEISGKYLDAVYRAFVHPPSLSMALGWKF